jgi:hypothetical protein
MQYALPTRSTAAEGPHKKTMLGNTVGIQMNLISISEQLTLDPHRPDMFWMPKNVCCFVTVPGNVERERGRKRDVGVNALQSNAKKVILQRRIPRSQGCAVPALVIAGQT